MFRIPTKLEVSAVLERFRLKKHLSRSAFARLILDTPANYQHVLRGRSYPQFKSLYLLWKMGVNVFKQRRDRGTV